MQTEITCRLLPSQSENEEVIRQYIAESTGKPLTSVSGYYPIKRSIDARGKEPVIQLTLRVFLDEPLQPRPNPGFRFQDVRHAPKQVIIVGAGPAGLFAALDLIERGIRPLILERGKDVRARRRDLAAMNKEGIVNPDSNYCFGEGGAGTYSDGKLYTRSHKRGDIDRILNLLVHFGAEEKIVYEAHPHIGTNKLPQIITAIREFILQCGGLFLFEQKVTDLIVSGDLISEVGTEKGDKWTGDAVILATGHSARDIFELLYRKEISIEFKPFALGVRVEHPQTLIDTIQYHRPDRGSFLPPASYSLVEQVEGNGVFSFCMCPGGIIAPAATAPGEIVVNGWSPSKRNNAYANSGIVTSIGEAQIKPFESFGVLAGLYFQQSVEQKAYAAGGGNLVAPAQRMGDFVQKKLSSNLPDCSYIPGLKSAPLQEVLPPYVYKGLQEAFVRFGKKMKGYYTNEAVVVATESRTSSPVRIPREAQTLAHPQIRNLYPCGEGAGYAGGIVSAAMDGQRVAQLLADKLG